LSLGWRIHGIVANAEHFVLLPALLGIWLLIVSVEKQKLPLLWISGMLLGFGFLMKQHGILFIIFALVYLVFNEIGRRPFCRKIFAGRVLLFGTGVVLPFGMICLWLWRMGVFEKFWFWTFDYASKYVTGLSFSDGWEGFKLRSASIVKESELLWIISGFGLALFWLRKDFRKRRLFLLGFGVFSFLAICPGLYFRPHYFIFLLPAASIFAAIGAICIFDFCLYGRGIRFKTVAAILLSVIVLGYTLHKQSYYFFEYSPLKVSRLMYGVNPFPESIEIAKYLRENSTSKDKIAVIGSEPQIYFYSNRRAATGYLYTYALMEDHQYAIKMQGEMINEIESAEPKYMVFVNVLTSWLRTEKSNDMIFKWFLQYIKHYRKVGVVDIIANDRTDYYWGDEAAGYEPKSELWLAVFERK
jgi:asparagine N-glycosylation enzyme membrane subunit Stt3